MILSDLEIVARLAEEDPSKRLVVTPLTDPVHQIGPSSLDVRLGVGFKIPITSHSAHVDRHDKVSVANYMRKLDIGSDKQLYIHPGEFILGSTLEYVRIPADLACRVEGRSSWGRLGLLVHATASFVDPGFSGNITFELFNAGRLPILLKSGDRMAQLCFMRLTGVPLVPYNRRPESKYRQTLSTEASRIAQDD